MPRQGSGRRSSVARARDERAARLVEKVRPRGELVLTLEVWLDDHGRPTVNIDTDRDEEAVAALLEVVAAQIQPRRTRAEEFEAWGAGRRR